VQTILARNTGARFSGKRIHELTKQDLTTVLADETQVCAVTSSLVVLGDFSKRIPLVSQNVEAGLIKMSYLGNSGWRSNRASTACIAALPSAMPLW